jgi:predicted deacylase
MLRRQGRRFASAAAMLLLAGCAAQQPTTRPAAAGPHKLADRPAATQPATSRPTTLPATVIGNSVEGRPIQLYTFGEPFAPETVFIFGGIHGNEPTSAGVCRELAGYLARHPELLVGRCVVLLPEANPDGLFRRLRTNAGLVDLNRNFPATNWKKTRRSGFFGGDEPLNQPESRLLARLIDNLKPARIVAVHSMDNPCNNYDGPAEVWANLMARHNGYPVKASIGYPTPGSFGSWAGNDKKIPVITLELPSRGTTQTSWEKNRAALVAFIRGTLQATTSVQAGE